MRLAELAGRRVVVWGLGAEGRAAAQAARAAGAGEVTVVVDTAPDAAVAANWATGDLGAVPVLAGPEADAARRSADVLLLSPGVSRYRPEVRAAEKRGVVVSNGTAIFLADHADRTVTVTGSKGKSTVTTLSAHLLRAVGYDAVAAGNVGVPLLTLVGDDRLVVAEVSSYQAALVDTGAAVAVLTSLFPEHLPWHGDVDRYYADKLRLFTAGPADQRAMVNAADPGVSSRLADPALARAVAFGRPGDVVHLADGHLVAHGDRAFSLHRSPLPGAHNAVNVAAAVAVLDAVGVDAVAEGDRIEEALARFSPLPHRLETVATVGGITFVDDSLATTAQAAVMACAAFPDRPLALVVGGLDRGLDYTLLVRYLSERARSADVTVVAMDEAGRRMAESLSGVAVSVCDDVAEAAAVAAGLVPAGGVVIFAPAAPSPARYGSYERRSEAFREGVRRLQAPGSAMLR